MHFGQRRCSFRAPSEFVADWAPNSLRSIIDVYSIISDGLRELIRRKEGCNKKILRLVQPWSWIGMHSGEQIYIFIDSQAALKRLDKLSQTGGQYYAYKITQICQKLKQQQNSIYFS